MKGSINLFIGFGVILLAVVVGFLIMYNVSPTQAQQNVITPLAILRQAVTGS